MLPLLSFLAATAPPTDNSNVIFAGIVSVLGVVSTIIARVTGKRDGRTEEQARRVTIDQQPVGVKLEDHFVTRREFDNFRADTAINFTKTEAAILRSADRIDNKHLELLATIETAAKTGTNGRVAIWEDLKEQGERLAAVESKVDIGERLERVAKELTTKPRPRNGQ
jgi:hypothetical protein